MTSETMFPRDEDFLEYIRSFVDECRLSAAAVDRLFTLARRGAEIDMDKAVLEGAKALALSRGLSWEKYFNFHAKWKKDARAVIDVALTLEKSNGK